MIREEIVKLGRFVKACCPSQQFDRHTPDAWMLILADLDYDDARRAVAEIVRQPLEPGKSRYIEPGHIVGGVKRIRAQRLEVTPVPPPPPEIESPADQIAWQRKVREQIANGTFVAPEDHPKAIVSVPAGSWRDLIRSADPDAPKATKPERRTEISAADAEAERARQLAALEAIASPQQIAELIHQATPEGIDQ